MQFIGPAVHEELKDIGNESYSLINDEISDVTTKKQLCVVIRYHSKKLSQITQKKHEKGMVSNFYHRYLHAVG